jgi:hypothetical protein
VNRNAFAQNLSTLLSALLMASCQNGLSPSDGGPLAIATSLHIATTSPINGAINVAVDDDIEITFDRKIDTPSVHPTQVEIWTESGNKLDWHDVQVGGRYIENGSVMKIHPKNSYWLPMTKYYVALRGQLPKDSTDSPTLAGVRGIDGSYLDPTSFSFTTGTEYKNDIFSGGPQVVTISPGTIFYAGADGSAQSIGEAFKGAITIYPNNNINIATNKAVKHWAVDKLGQPLTREIPPTPIGNLTGLAVAVIDARTPIASFAKSIPDAVKNPGEWQTFMKTVLKQQLKGTVHTENSRRLIIFELDKNCNGEPTCGYPDNTSLTNIASAVVVIVSGFVSVDMNLPMVNAPTFAGFIHFSGYKAGDGYPSVDSALGGLKGIFQP